jgi:hypothetical protein
MSHRKSRGSTAPALTLAQFNAAVDAVQQAVGDLDEGQHCGEAKPPTNRRPCASVGEAKRFYAEVEAQMYAAGRPLPPDPFAAKYGEWWDPTLRPYAKKWNWWKWWKKWLRWSERERARLMMDAGTPQGVASKGMSKIDQAIMVKRKHPDWTAARIADEVGCKPSNLSQSSRWDAAVKACEDAARQGFHREGKDRRAKDRDRRGKDRRGTDRGRDMDQYADGRREPVPMVLCESKGCGDPADRDSAGQLLEHDGKPRCRECWEQLCAQRTPAKGRP